MYDYHDFRVIFTKGNVNIEVYVTLPAEELSNDLEVDGLSNDDSTTILYWAQDTLIVDHNIHLYIPNWDWEIEGLS